LSYNDHSMGVIITGVLNHNIVWWKDQ